MSLFGGAEEVYIRASEIIFNKMIPFIIMCNPVAKEQCGEAFYFSRRTPEMSELSPNMTIGQIFDQIRMLDVEGYPKAYIEFGNYRLCFSRPKRTIQGLISDVEIKEIEND